MGDKYIIYSELKIGGFGARFGLFIPFIVFFSILCVWKFDDCKSVKNYIVASYFFSIICILGIIGSFISFLIYKEEDLEEDTTTPDKYNIRNSDERNSDEAERYIIYNTDSHHFMIAYIVFTVVLFILLCYIFIRSKCFINSDSWLILILIVFVMLLCLANIICFSIMLSIEEKVEKVEEEIDTNIVVSYKAV